MRTGRHRDAQDHAGVGRCVALRIFLPAQLPRGDREHLQARAVEGELHFLRLAQSFEVLVAIARQVNLELVFGIERERVTERRAAARAVGKVLEMIVLREVGRQDDGERAGRSNRTADGEARDLLRRRQIAIEQRRRQGADVDVVEPVARIVGRQHRRGVDVEREQIADRVLIFSAIQAMEGVVATRIGRGRRRAIERRLEIGLERLIGRLVGPRTARTGRRHRARANPADDFFPAFRMGGQVLDDDFLEHPPAAFHPLAVTAAAIARDHGEAMPPGRRPQPADRQALGPDRRIDHGESTNRAAKTPMRH